MQEKIAINYPLRQLFRDLWRLLGPYRGRFLLATALRALSDLAWLYPAIALATFVNFFTSYTPGQPVSDDVLMAGLLWIGVALFHNVAEETSNVLGYGASERIQLDAELAAYDRLFQIDLAWHEKENTGNKVKRIQRGGRAIDDLLRMWIDSFIEASIQFVGTIVILASFDTRIAWLMVVFIASYYPLSVMLTKRAVSVANEVNVLEEGISGVAHEAISNIRSVKVLGMGRALLSTLQSQVRDMYRKIQERILRFRTRTAILRSWGLAFRLGSFFFVAWLITQGKAEVGLLIIAYEYFGRMWQSTDQIGDKTHQIVVAQYEIGRMQAIFDAPTTTDESANKQKVPSAWSTIQLRNLSFSYGSRRVLRDLSLTIRRSERVGIVGVSGAGKSTLFKLLLKEHENYTGQILIDETPLNQIAKRSFTECTAVVLQDTRPA